MVSSRATCINRISAPHAKQRIPPIHSFLFVTSAAIGRQGRSSCQDIIAE